MNDLMRINPISSGKQIWPIGRFITQRPTSENYRSRNEELNDPVRPEPTMKVGIEMSLLSPTNQAKKDLLASKSTEIPTHKRTEWQKNDKSYRAEQSMFLELFVYD